MQKNYLPRLFVSLLLLSLLVSLSTPVLAAEKLSNTGQPASAISSGQAIPLANLLNPDGTLNLPEGRYGNIDMSGWQMTGDLNQAPRFAPLAPIPPEGVPGDENWNGGFGLADADNNVNALLFGSDGSLYASGMFTTTGRIIGTNIARWDGDAWNPIGYGFNDTVNALVFDSGGNLYAGGAFTGICADVPCTSLISANRVAMWNGSAWSAVGNGFDNTVNALAFGDSNYLYAGGSFKNICDSLACATFSLTNYIARWNGSVWNPTGPGFSDVVKALAYDGGNFVYAGGAFRYYCGSLGSCGTANPANRIARWRVSAAAWEKVGDGTKNGVSATVNALAFNSTGTLYVGGDFVWICNTYSSCSSASIYANRIARWSSETWSAMNLGVGPSSTAVNALTFDASDNLYIGGSFTGICTTNACTTGSTTANRVATWDGSAWVAVGNGLNNTVNALVYDSNLYAGGAFTGICADAACTANLTAVHYMAQWDTTNWIHVNPDNHYDLNNTVFALAFDDTGNLYVGGSFTAVGGVTANRVAMWTGASWSILGFGLNNTVNALYFDGTNLYAGGTFTFICSNAACTGSTVNANRMARWIGGSWNSVANGLRGDVYTLAYNSGNLYAGGAFTGICTNATCSTSTSANRIATWNGSAWSTLDASDLGLNGTVNALAFDNSNNLYAGGAFTRICASAACTTGGAAANRAVMWNGTNWNAVSNGVNGTINALAFDQASWDLYAGGAFKGLCGDISCTVTNTLTANRIVMWDNSTWSTVGNGFNDTVNALAFDGSGNLYAGGKFTGICNDSACSSPTSARYNARWNSTQWNPMGIGTNLSVSALALKTNGDLYVGGAFTTAGTHASFHLAYWTAAVGACGVTAGNDYTLYPDMPVTFHITTTGTLDCITVQRVNTDHPNAGEFQQTGYYWSIRAVNSSNAPAAGYEVGLTLPYATAGNGDQLCRYDTGSASWDCADDRTYVANTSVTRNHVTQLSDWVIGDYPEPKTLTVSKTGAGSGAVSSNPPGINCGTDCSEVYEHGTSVVLSPVATLDSYFAGWNGACTGTGDCTVVMTETKNIAAAFEKNTLTVNISGAGEVTSSPPGITCGADCSEIYDRGTVVTLTAVPAAGGSIFYGWSGACTGTGPCVITINQAEQVTANFRSVQYLVPILNPAIAAAHTTSNQTAGLWFATLLLAASAARRLFKG